MVESSNVNAHACAIGCWVTVEDDIDWVDCIYTPGTQSQSYKSKEFVFARRYRCH